MRRPALCLALLAIGSCSKDDGPTPIDLDLGGGFLGIVDGSAKLIVSSADGRVLLEGLPPGTIPADGPPLVGFAVRDVTTTYEMSFGAFKPTVTPSGPWKGGQSFSGNAQDLQVLDASGKALAHLSFSTPESGHLVVHLSSDEKDDPAKPSVSRQISWGFACNADDHFAGFGAQTWDTDHRGQTVPTFVTEEGVGKSTTDDFSALWQLQGQRHSSQAPIPEFLSRRGYLLVAQTDRRAQFALCSEKDTAARIEIDLPVDIHVFDGPEPTAALSHAAAVFGKPRMPPRVAFAPWGDAIFGSDNVRAVAKKLRDNQIPISVIWTEDWRGGDWNADDYSLEEWEVDRDLYPDIEQVASDLHNQGFDFYVYFNPFIYQGSKAWSETEPKGYLVKTQNGDDYVFEGAKLTQTGLIDLDNPGARQWAIGKMQDAIALGADGWMNDFGEWLPTDAVTSKGPAYDEHNRYPVLWQQVAREAIDTSSGGKDRLFFARSAWFGSPPLADVFWAGDQRTTFDADDGMPTVLPIGIGLGIVGISTYGSDVAGYQAANNAGSTKEVFFRWTELGAWSPVMRTHHGAQPKKNWSWQSDDETIAHFKRYTQLHMALVPTFSGLAQVASNTGIPIWRSLAISYPEDAKVWPITDQVMIGESVLLAPVQTAGATSRSVYLPKGRWYPWDGGAAVEGPVQSDISAAVDQVPVFVRAGGIVPMFPDGVMTLVHGSAAVPGEDSIEHARVVRVFLGADGSFTENGDLSYSLDHLADADGSTITVTFTAPGEKAVTLAECGSTKDSCVETVGGDLLVHTADVGVVDLAQGKNAIARIIAKSGSSKPKMTFQITH